MTATAATASSPRRRRFTPDTQRRPPPWRFPVGAGAAVRRGLARTGDLRILPRMEDATRASYDAVAERYADEIGGELAGKPVDRALLGCLAELTATGVPGQPVG